MDNADAQELRKFGYAQQLRRSLGAFSSFAVAFSLISAFTGVFVRREKRTPSRSFDWTVGWNGSSYARRAFTTRPCTSVNR